jgi:hypothetical protein
MVCCFNFSMVTGTVDIFRTQELKNSRSQEVRKNK